VSVLAGVTSIAANKVTDERYSTALNQAYCLAYPTGLRAGDIFYVTTAGKLARLAAGTSGQYLKQSATIPFWGDLVGVVYDIGDTVTGPLWVSTDDDEAFMVRKTADGLAAFTVDMANELVEITNGSSLVVWAGDYTTELARINGGTGDITTAGSLLVEGSTTLGDAAADVTLIQGHLKHRGVRPSIAVGVALGSGGSVGATIIGTDQAGTVTLVAGTSSLSSGVAATVTFAAARPDTNYVVMLQTENSNAGLNAVLVRAPGTPGATTTTWTVTFGAAPTSGTTYKYHYLVVEWVEV
jgi:hypothetical protein